VGKDLAGVFGFPLVAALIMAALLTTAKGYFVPQGEVTPIWVFPALVCSGAAVYSACLFLFSKIFPHYRPLKGFIEALKADKEM
jgi:hypothetical protein